ncbi:HdeA/HdeB family chaperone [Acuticoccus mangrovi]|uniref:HdeA/HdeB family protein n=1 Tax=Acuticoccus mangrovi TaxID=2796142 RepID=A0A934MM56_9HYPH|nr:HdeA/HdeB family chaperone [Acuticoccus mangrovi]MBJ3776969.1 hypothetical protein [Acuticoccus mangrovi]
MGLRHSAYCTLLAALGVVAVAATPALAQGEAEDDAEAVETTVDLSALTCKDLMGQDGEMRPRTISFLHGYVAGADGVTEVDVEALVDATALFIDQCLDNPTANALETLKSIVQ